MNGTTSGIFAVVLFFGASILVPAFSTDVASAENSTTFNLSVVRLLDNQYRQSSTGTWGPGFDAGRPAHYRSVAASQCNGGCNRCAVRNYDRDASARDCCSLCPFVSGYRCDLYSCGWVRDYDCGTCRL
jgi:hypothetical protein